MSEYIDCATHNPCGRHGYCRDQVELGSSVCECKFWWVGQYCNEQSSSGTQVIILGCLLGVLVLIIYCFKIYKVIERRKSRQTNHFRKDSTQDNITDALKNHVHTYTRVASWSCALLTIIIAVVALIVKWSIISQIHEEIVDKYRTNQSIYYEANSICTKLYVRNFHLVTFPISCFLVILFALQSKRTSFMRDKCSGYGAIPMPLDFLAHMDRTFAAMIFAASSLEIIKIIVETINGSSSTKGEGVIVSYLLRLSLVLAMGLRYYPYLAAVYINTFVTLICGTLYAWLDFSMDVINQAMCDSDVYPTDENYDSEDTSIVDLLQYFGTGSSLVTIQVCVDIPRYICMAYICVRLPFLFIRKVCNRYRKDLSDEARLLMKLTREQRRFLKIATPNSAEMQYVKNILTPPNQRPLSRALFARIIPRFIYQWRDDFRYSTRIVCIYSSISLLIYYMIMEALTLFLPTIISLQNAFQILMDAISNAFFPLPVQYGDAEVSSLTSNYPVPNLLRPYIIAVVITFTITIIQMIVLLANIRRNLLQAFRGDDSEIPRRQSSKFISYSAGNVHFAGYFIGYLVWGIFLILFFSLVLCFSIQAFITYGSVRFLEKILKIILPPILFTQFKRFLNLFLAQFVFLQDHGDVLALNNRRTWMIYVYFSFFIDAFLGFISSIVRLIKSVIGGTIYMCRLDYSPLGRKLESMDSGFSAYCGLIHTECTHRHPVMLVFVAHLYAHVKMREIRTKQMSSEDANTEEKIMEVQRISSRYRRKWKIAAFLVRHPKLIFFRKSFLISNYQSQTKPVNMSNEEDTIRNGLKLMLPAMTAVDAHYITQQTSEFVINQRF